MVAGGDVTPPEGTTVDADEKGIAKGIEAVEDMLMAELKKEDSSSDGMKAGDLKTQYLTGLKAAGLDLSAA